MKQPSQEQAALESIVEEMTAENRALSARAAQYRARLDEARELLMAAKKILPTSLIREKIKKFLY